MNKEDPLILPSKTIQRLLLSKELNSISYLKEINNENEIIYLDKNENPFPPPIRNFSSPKFIKSLNNYPDPNSTTFLNDLSQHLKIPTSFLLIGSGSDELIDLIIRTYSTPKSTVLSVSPTFSMYEFYTKINGAKFESQLLKLKLNNATGIAQFDLDQNSFMQKAKFSNIIILARPNNPDGMLISLNFIKQLLELKKLVIIDEAYIDFSDKSSMMDLIKIYNNLIISRSFSKSYSLAGLRLGYIIANPSIINILNCIKSPYNVNRLASQFGSLVLNNQKEVSANIDKIKSIRDNFYKALIRLRKIHRKFYIHPSEANFILLRFQSPEISDSLHQHFLKYKIKVRRFKSELSNCLRISIGTSLQMKRVIEILKLYFEVN